jgi:hypothetical protein
MNPVVIRSASITDVSSIVEIRLRALAAEEVLGFVVPEDNLY